MTTKKIVDTVLQAYASTGIKPIYDTNYVIADDHIVFACPITTLAVAARPVNQSPISSLAPLVNDGLQICGAKLLNTKIELVLGMIAGFDKRPIDSIMSVYLRAKLFDKYDLVRGYKIGQSLHHTLTPVKYEPLGLRVQIQRS